MSDDLMFQSVGELAAAVREGDISARELVEASLQAIERLNGDVNAFVTLCEERALAEADAFKPGLYTCQVNIIDDVAGRFAFPRLALYVR